MGKRAKWGNTCHDGDLCEDAVAMRESCNYHIQSRELDLTDYVDRILFMLLTEPHWTGNTGNTGLEILERLPSLLDWKYYGKSTNDEKERFRKRLPTYPTPTSSQPTKSSALHKIAKLLLLMVRPLKTTPSHAYIEHRIQTAQPS